MAGLLGWIIGTAVSVVLGVAFVLLSQPARIENSDPDSRRRRVSRNFDCDFNDAASTSTIGEEEEGKPTKYCSICLGHLNKKTVEALECAHIFHQTCIRKWLREKRQCPICLMKVSYNKNNFH
ncbi:hypothetical protein JTB14_005640 [Gonioctena quinquepunctata]|nr:hypothetical protein JTB14_005640 [Gonioctena quinquepunctata]